MALTFLAPILYQRSGDASDQLRNAGVNRVVWETTFACLALTLLGVLVAFLAHEWLFRFLVAPQYRNVSHLLPWMVMAGGLFAAGQILALKLMSEMKSARLALAKIVTALLGVGFNVYGAAVAGLAGVIAALVAFSLVYLAWMMWLARSRGTTIGRESVFMRQTLKSPE
jgi:O-antigen/teichoic acid export membrane protein